MVFNQRHIRVLQFCLMFPSDMKFNVMGHGGVYEEFFRNAVNGYLDSIGIEYKLYSEVYKVDGCFAFGSITYRTERRDDIQKAVTEIVNTLSGFQQLCFGVAIVCYPFTEDINIEKIIHLYK